jgi:membrane protein required for colicin V production
MAIIDMIFVVIVLFFVGLGLMKGLLYSLISFIGTIIGVFVASRYFEPMADWLIATFDWAENLSRVVVFIIAFLIINQVIGLAFLFLKKISRWFNKVPFLGWINRIAGGAFGLLQSVVILAFIVYVIERFPLSEALMTALAESMAAPYLSGIAALLVPLLPDALQTIQSTVDYAKDSFLG